VFEEDAGVELFELECDDEFDDEEINQLREELELDQLDLNDEEVKKIMKNEKYEEMQRTKKQMVLCV
jgi:hypothetical protein